MTVEPDLVPCAAERAFLAHIIDDPADDLRRLVFADWLEEHGQGQRATYIRARCALDGKRPEFGTYVDAIEELEACGYQQPRVALPRGFSFHQRRGDRTDWWDESDDTMEGGMPSLACVDPGALEVADSARLLALRLQTLVETTTIRGLKLGDDVSSYAAVLFASPAASAIMRLGLEYRHEGELACPAVVALAASPMARTLTWLDVSLATMNRAMADALATAPFEALRRFDLLHGSSEPEVYRRLMDAPWFRRLERLVTHVPPGAFGWVALPSLHSLSLWLADDGLFKAFARRAELPALRRLMIALDDLHGARAIALAALRCGELVELGLNVKVFRPSDLEVLLAARWARRLEVLTIYADQRVYEKFHDIIDKSPCAKALRIRRVG